MAEDAAAAAANKSLILAQNRTTRRDPTHNLNYYTGGWNISNRDYIAVSTLYNTPINPFFQSLCVFHNIYRMKLQTNHLVLILFLGTFSFSFSPPLFFAPFVTQRVFMMLLLLLLL